MAHSTDRTSRSRQSTHPTDDLQDSASKNSQGVSLEVIPPAADGAFRAVFESSAEALLVLNRAGTVQRANPRACELLRCKRGGLAATELAMHLAQPAPMEFAHWCASLSAANAPSIIDGLLISGFPVRISFRAALPGSSNFLLCIEEGSLVQRAEGKWRQLEAELTTALDSVQAGAILLNPAGSIRFINARFSQYFAMDHRQVRSLEVVEDLHALIAPRFRTPETFAAPWRAFAAGSAEPGHDELEMTRPTRRVLERFARPVQDNEGRTVGWLELYTDVTGERQIQSKLLQTEKMAAVGQLVSGIAHELNNPLTAIMGYGQLLLGHGLSPEQFSEANKIFQEAGRARRIVKNLLYFARENQPERTRVDLNEIVERTLALRSYELRVENILVECDLAADLRETMADPYQLQQVVLNLLMNAEQALLQDRGQGHVRIRTRTAGENRIAVEISDDGPGIPREIASRIFDPFFTTKPSGVGTGLGLSIVYGIVKQHDGEVMLDTQNGVGANFIVELPVIAVPAAQRNVEIPETQELAIHASKGRILVVEDEPTVAQLIVDVLREEGHQVEAVLDSREGLTRLSRARYDLVICDLRMPRLDGPAFYDALVRAGSSAQDRIMFVTGDSLA
ncbi:MAG: ATP-binding protein, partial [Candidatus Acidiferrales bacterium]